MSSSSKLEAPVFPSCVFAPVAISVLDHLPARHVEQGGSKTVTANVQLARQLNYKLLHLVTINFALLCAGDHGSCPQSGEA